MATSNYNPPRKKGPQKPSRYPGGNVGPRYRIWGEQPGFIYNPYQDEYIPDVEGQQKALQDAGVLPGAPKEPSLVSSLLPLGGAALAGEAGKYIGKDIVPDLIGGAKGLLGIGSQAASNIGPVANGSEYAASLAGGPSGLFSSSLVPLAGAYGAYDLFKNDYGPGRGGLQGAASGAAIGSAIPGVGTLLGAGIGGLLGLGKGLMNRGYSDLEDQKRKKLAAMGIDVSGGDGAWENNADFAKSRDESKLRGEDILGAADWQLKYGDRWGATDRARQIEIANEAIKRGLIREHNGGIDINTGGLSDFIKAA